jgi:hypothetical protein
MIFSFPYFGLDKLIISGRVSLENFFQISKDSLEAQPVYPARSQLRLFAPNKKLK